MCKKWEAVSAIVGAWAAISAAQVQAEPAAPKEAPPIAATMDDLTPASPPTSSTQATTTPTAAPSLTAATSPTTPTAATAAIAPSKFSFQFGAAMSWMVSDIEYAEGTISLGEAMHIEAGYRLGPTFAVAAHLGVAFGHSFQEELIAFQPGEVSTADVVTRFYYHVYEVGAALQIFPTRQLWISPWLGFAEQEGKQLALGAGFGYDFLIAKKNEPSHRLGAFAKALYANGERDESIRAFQLGLAYSFR